jgi:hypothetical protein
MTDHTPRTSRAGGALLAGAIMAGALIGVMAGEPSIGLLAGAFIGGAALAFLWWKDRRG